MKIYSSICENKNLSLALGYFDGVHKGHQAVIQNAVDFAKRNSVKSAVITFKDHPCCYFWKVKPQYILSREERQKQLEILGVDYLYELDFEDFANLTAEDYIEQILVKNFKPSAISTGFNHNFGHNKTGNTDYLQQMSKVFNFKYFMSNPITYNDELISSTNIRNTLSVGDIKKANEMLGFNFPIEGIVVEGQKLGRQIGFRTANIIYPTEIINLPFGAYKTVVIYNGTKYNAVTNIGIRPTVSSSNNCVIETHILDFNKNIYGDKLRIEFIELLRKEQKFDNLNELKFQIQKDIAYCKNT